MLISSKKITIKIIWVLFTVLIISGAFLLFEIYQFWELQDKLQSKEKEYTSLVESKKELETTISEERRKIQLLKVKVSKLRKFMKAYNLPLQIMDLQNFISEALVNYNLTLQTAKIGKDNMFLSVEGEFYGKEKGILYFLQKILDHSPLQVENMEISRPDRETFLKIKFGIPEVKRIPEESNEIAKR